MSTEEAQQQKQRIDEIRADRVNYLCDNCKKQDSFDHECDHLNDPHSCTNCDILIADGCGCCGNYYVCCYDCITKFKR